MTFAPEIALGRAPCPTLGDSLIILLSQRVPLVKDQAAVQPHLTHWGTIVLAISTSSGGLDSRTMPYSHYSFKGQALPAPLWNSGTTVVSLGTNPLI